MEKAMRILVTGASGLLGYDVVNELLYRGIPCAGCSRSVNYAGLERQIKTGIYNYTPLDLCNGSAVEILFRSIQPTAVIHCAAWRDAVSAELPENKTAVFAVNALATRQLAQLCGKTGCKMIYLSSDYVFNGSGDIPWMPDTTVPDPLNVYGCSKLAGEQAVANATDSFFVVRTSWLFGAHGHNFVTSMLRLGATQGMLSVVDDQIGAPTYTKDLARLLVDMADSDAYGFYNATNSGGYISRYAFAQEIFRQVGLCVRLTQIHTADYPDNQLSRPLNGRLELSKLTANGFLPLPDWKDALSRYLKELKNDEQNSD